MRTILAVVFAVGTLAASAIAAEAPKKADVTIQSEILNKATAANLQKAGAETVLKAAEKATKLGIVIETVPGQRIPPLVISPSDPEFSTVLAAVKAVAARRATKAAEDLAASGVEAKK